MTEINHLGNVVLGLIGRDCRIETLEGSVRYEAIKSVSWHEIKINDKSVKHPTFLYFDDAETDSVNVLNIASIKVV